MELAKSIFLFLEFLFKLFFLKQEETFYQQIYVRMFARNLVSLGNLFVNQTVRIKCYEPLPAIALSFVKNKEESLSKETFVN